MRRPKLGVGIVYVPGLEPLLEPGNTCIDVVEVEPQTLWQKTSDRSCPYILPQRALRSLQQLTQEKIVHSVGFAVGGTHLPDPAFSRALIDTAEAIDAVWISEHLSVTHVMSDNEVFHTGFMLPPLQTPGGALCAAHTIRSLSKQLPVPFAVETPVNYLRPRPGELSDGEFVALAVEQADCGILLDLHNIWTNERNGRQSVADFLGEIPLERVWEVHVGGGFEFDGYWLDAHSGAVPEPVHELVEEVIPLLPNVSALIYEIFPSFVPLFGLDGVESQLERLTETWARCSAGKAKPEISIELGGRDLRRGEALDTLQSPESWEVALGELVTNGAAEGPLAEELVGDPGIPLMRKLIWKFRAGAVVKVLGALTKLFLLHSKQNRLDVLLDGYFMTSKPEPFASHEAKGFIGYLRSQNLEMQYLPEILAYEEACIEAAISQQAQYVHFPFDPMMLLQSLVNGQLPGRLEAGVFELEVPP